jgi:hypothetical protein
MAVRPAMLGLVSSLGLCCALLCGSAIAATNETTSFWDKALLDMELQHVDMRATSLYDARDKLGRGYLVRTVLAVGERGQRRGAFEFARAVCTVRDLIGAMLRTYGDYTLTQDPATGVLWIHPASMPYESILARQIEVPQGMVQVPMLQGVLRKLQEQPGSGVVVTGRGMVWEDAAAYPVTLSPGVFTLRDIINMCLQPSPSRTFGIQIFGTAAAITPGDILQSGQPRSEARPGSLRFWRLGMGKASEAEPSSEELLQALASADPHERWVARSFIHAERYHVPLYKMVMGAPRGRQAIWASLAHLTMGNLTAPSPLLPGAKRIQQEMSLDTAADLDRGTAVLAAMEMARVGDDALLKKVAQWSLAPDELASMYPDSVRIATLSKEVRTALREANCAWPGLSAKELRDMEERKPLVLHQ